mgnify:CR=1 FL=1
MSERIIRVRATTKAKSEKVEEISPGIFRVRTTEAPEKGKANARITELLAKHLGVPRSGIYLKSGHAAREKTFVVL